MAIKKYQSHINLEDYMSIKSVKYLFRYVYKGHDCASTYVYKDSKHSQVDHDEILMHLDTRYIYIYAYCIAMYVNNNL